MRHFFVIAAYPPGENKRIFTEVFSPRNEEFCANHGYQYEVVEEVEKFRGSYPWAKYRYIQRGIQEGRFKLGDLVVNMDSDQVFVKTNQDIPAPKSLSLAIDSCNSFCNSLLAFRLTPWSIRLVDEVLSEERWERLRDVCSHHEGLPGKYDSFYQEFREQAMLYSLLGVKRHSNISFWDLPNFGIHSEPTKDSFPLDKIQENVHLLHTAWNVTAWPGETSDLFHVNRVEREGVITRHFAGGQNWNNYKNWMSDTPD